MNYALEIKQVCRLSKALIISVWNIRAAAQDAVSADCFFSGLK
jgi:hypothetical protein